MSKKLVVSTLMVFAIIAIFGVRKQLVAGGEELALDAAEEEIFAAPDSGQEIIVTAPPSSLNEANNPLLLIAKSEVKFPEIDRVGELFTMGRKKMPIVETVDYTGHAEWLDRQVWVADYAREYNTSRHFIARSLNGKPDYFNQKVMKGSTFNVFKKDANINFYLLIDLARKRAGLYCYDLDANERVHLKTYRISVGALDSRQPSGCLTPAGRYLLGEKIAIYKPESVGYYKNQQVEMVRVFGTRWIPFQEEVVTGGSGHGFGLQGLPWNEVAGELVESRESIEGYNTFGSIRFLQEDMEEFFSIVITKKTFALVTPDFTQVELPGKEVNHFTRER